MLFEQAAALTVGLREGGTRRPRLERSCRALPVSSARKQHVQCMQCCGANAGELLEQAFQAVQEQASQSTARSAATLPKRAEAFFFFHKLPCQARPSLPAWWRSSEQRLVDSGPEVKGLPRCRQAKPLLLIPATLISMPDAYTDQSRGSMPQDPSAALRSLAGTASLRCAGLSLQ